MSEPLGLDGLPLDAPRPPTLDDTTLKDQRLELWRRRCDVLRARLREVSARHAQRQQARKERLKQLHDHVHRLRRRNRQLAQRNRVLEDQLRESMLERHQLVAELLRLGGSHPLTGEETPKPLSWIAARWVAFRLRLSHPRED